MISFVNVCLDDDMPEYMNGLIRCGSVISEDENGKETDHQDLIDNTEYHSSDELIKDIANRLNVRTDIVEISS